MATTDPSRSSSTPFASSDPGDPIDNNDNGASAFVIAELTGKQRIITLRERALPYKPIDFSGVHQVEETKYPGYTKTSQQALGATEDPSEFKGAWKTRFIGDIDSGGLPMFGLETATVSTDIDGSSSFDFNSTQVTNAALAIETMDDVRRQGQVLKVTWAHIVRIGRLVEFRQSWSTIHDCEWMMKFKWIGRDENPGMPSPGNATLLDMSRQMAAGYVGVHNATNFDGIDELDPDIADQIDGEVGTLQRAVMDLQDAVDNRVNSAISGENSLRRALTISTYIRDQADGLIESMNEIPSPAMCLVPQFSGTGSTPVTAPNQRDLRAVPAGQAAAAGIALRLAVQATRALKHTAARQRFQALRQLDANALAVVVLAQNEDMHALSKKFYGTPDEADRIRSFNGFTSMSMPAGTIVVIPQQRAAA